MQRMINTCEPWQVNIHTLNIHISFQFNSIATTINIEGVSNFVFNLIKRFSRYI